MRITILNGALEPGSLDEYVGELSASLETAGHAVRVLTLRDMDIAGCQGCFGCWVKTPGRCINPDDSEIVCRENIQSDILIYASPVIMGFISSTLKNAMDRTVSLVMPYMRTVNGEVHHVMRYEKHVDTAVVLERGADCDEEDLDIIKSIFERNTYNFESSLRFFGTTESAAEEVAHAINNI
ncbi:MAG: flavodoxin family protein [bacterium]|nr:flavodoxin family protein [bacterium]